MLAAFRAGKSPYKIMASRIFDVPYDDIDETTQEGWFMRWVGKNAVLGLGYQMGAPKFRATCLKYGQDIDEELALRTVNIYRETNYKIKEFWYIAFAAFKQAVENINQIVNLGPIQLACDGKYLFVKLPSGRTLTYVTPRVATVEKDLGPTEVIQYKGLNSKTRQWQWIELYGGKITENLVQAIARDLMMQGMFNCIDAGFDFLLTVHDQILCESDRAGRLDEYIGLMTKTPRWAVGFPIEAEGKECRRFSK
jgi:DNA polymerase